MQEFNTTLDTTNGHDYNDQKFNVVLEPLTENKHLVGDINETYSLSGFTIHLVRSPTPFLMNTLFPTGLLTSTSLIGFLVPVGMVPGRMALLVTIFLMLVNISNNERNRGPVVSEFSALYKKVMAW